MLVEVYNQAQARRLELDGHSRTGSKAVEASLDQLNSILDRGDVSVQKVSLNRQNGDDEGAIIDRVIRNHSGIVNQEYAERSYNATSDNPIRRRSRRLFRVKEDSLTIYRDFAAVIEGDYQLRATSKEDLKELKERLREDLDEEIESLKDQARRIDGLTLADVFED